MSDSNYSGDVNDKKLQSLFEQLRASDRRVAPDFPQEYVQCPDEQASAVHLVEKTGAARNGAGALNPPAPWRATGALAAALLVALLVQPAAKSPDDLYLEIMQANTLLTDDMMIASPSIAPELGSFDELYSEPTFTGSQTYWN